LAWAAPRKNCERLTRIAGAAIDLADQLLEDAHRIVAVAATKIDGDAKPALRRMILAVGPPISPNTS
jgi:hypothetical protein